MNEVEKLAMKMWERLPVRLPPDVFCWEDADQDSFLSLAREILRRKVMKKPKTEVKFSKPSKADIAAGIRNLRYMHPEDIAKDFKSPKERAAIEAVFRWLSLNACTAWSLKRNGSYSTVARSSRVRRDIGTWTAIVLDKTRLDKAEALLLKSKKK
jgi:hypothetical protein